MSLLEVQQKLRSLLRCIAGAVRRGSGIAEGRNWWRPDGPHNGTARKTNHRAWPSPVCSAPPAGCEIRFDGAKDLVRAWPSFSGPQFLA